MAGSELNHPDAERIGFANLQSIFGLSVADQILTGSGVRRFVPSIVQLLRIFASRDTAGIPVTYGHILGAHWRYT